MTDLLNKKLHGLVVITSRKGKVLSRGKNMVLKCGYDTIIDSFIGINSVTPPNSTPKYEPFLTSIVCGNGTDYVSFSDIELSGSVTIALPITDNFLTFTGGDPIIESRFTISQGSSLEGYSLSEVGLWSPTNSLLFSRVLLSPVIPITSDTILNGYYYLSTIELDEQRIFDSTFDETFE